MRLDDDDSSIFVELENIYLKSPPAVKWVLRYLACHLYTGESPTTSECSDIPQGGPEYLQESNTRRRGKALVVVALPSQLYSYFFFWVCFPAQGGPLVQTSKIPYSRPVFPLSNFSPPPFWGFFFSFRQTRALLNHEATSRVSDPAVPHPSPLESPHRRRHRGSLQVDPLEGEPPEPLGSHGDVALLGFSRAASLLIGSVIARLLRLAAVLGEASWDRESGAREAPGKP